MAEKHSDKIPQYEINALARCLLPEIQKFFASPEGQKNLKNGKHRGQRKQNNIKAYNKSGGIVMIPPLLL